MSDLAAKTTNQVAGAAHRSLLVPDRCCVGDCRMRCDDVRPLISVGLDGELDEGRSAQMRAHLAGCAQCAAEREALSVTVRLLRALPEADPPAELRRRIGAALLDAQRRPQGRWLGLLGLVRPPRPAWSW